MRGEAFGVRAQPVDMRAVEGDDGSAAGFETFEYLRLRVGDGGFRGEKFNVGGSDGSDDSNVGPHQPRER